MSRAHWIDHVNRASHGAMTIQPRALHAALPVPIDIPSRQLGYSCISVPDRYLCLDVYFIASEASESESVQRLFKFIMAPSNFIFT
jgi:hypothetical protein